VNFLAWARFDSNKVLVETGKTPRDQEAFLVILGGLCPRVIMERPYIQQVDPTKRKGRATQEDVQELCIAAGEYAGRFKYRRYDYPYTLNKDLRHKRALEALTAQELRTISKLKTHRAHVLCAVYMGLRETGRIRA
jgi:hypothetical protein